MRSALEKVLRDKALAERFGHEGWQRVHREFSWSSVASKSKNLI